MLSAILPSMSITVQPQDFSVIVDGPHKTITVDVGVTVAQLIDAINDYQRLVSPVDSVEVLEQPHLLQFYPSRPLPSVA